MESAHDMFVYITRSLRIYRNVAPICIVDFVIDVWWKLVVGLGDRNNGAEKTGDDCVYDTSASCRVWDSCLHPLPFRLNSERRWG